MFDLAIEDRIAHLRLSRPEARNAIPLAGWDDLAAAARQAESAGARAMILSGVPGGVFCAGADIADFEAFRSDAAARASFREAIRRGLDAVRALSIPVVALVEGPCYGAGVALAMTCDVRIAGPGAQFAITPAKLGISYPQQDVHRLVSLVGPGQAARLLFTASSIGGAEAARIGLAELHVEEGAPEAASALAEAMAQNEPQSLRTLKRAVRLAAEGVFRDEQQDRTFEDLLGSAALFERLEAYRSRPK